MDNIVAESILTSRFWADDWMRLWADEGADASKDDDDATPQEVVEAATLLEKLHERMLTKACKLDGRTMYRVGGKDVFGAPRGGRGKKAEKVEKVQVAVRPYPYFFKIGMAPL